LQLDVKNQTIKRRHKNMVAQVSFLDFDGFLTIDLGYEFSEKNVVGEEG